MPIYEYVCKNGHRFERYSSVKEKEEPLETVPCNVGKCKSQFIIAELVPSQTGAPILKAGGVGGFYKPSRG